MTDANSYDIPKLLDDKAREELYGSELDPLVAQLFYNRDITDKKDIDAFFDFDWSGIHNPFLYKDMEKGVERILKAISNNEKILIYSDYDTDGIPGGALMYTFFTKIGYENFSNYIPNRNKDGYSLNIPACEKFITDSVDVLITVDCGITDNTEVDLLMKGGVDVIITDHHLPEGDVPNAYAVIDHKQNDCTYPDENLCGCGVAWKLVCALLERGKEQGVAGFAEVAEGWEKTLLDLVAISTICDMVPLVGENRLLVHFGKIMLGLSARPGLHTIFKKSRLNATHLQTDDIAFMIGPRINAASRLDDPMIAFAALAYHDERAIAAATELEKLNNRRKYMTAKIMKEVWGKLEDREDSPVIVIGNPEWPLGILGLIAGKIADREKRPTFVWSRVGDHIKGSCRSGTDISVFSLMQHTRDSFDGFGGHAASGGFETDGEKIHFLQDELGKNIDKAERINRDKIHIDAQLAIDRVEPATHKLVHTLEPFGMNNPKPLFIFHHVVSKVRVFGKTANHLELGFTNSVGRNVKAIAFFRQDLINKNIESGHTIRFVGTLEKEVYKQNEYISLRLHDIL